MIDWDNFDRNKMDDDKSERTQIGTIDWDNFRKDRTRENDFFEQQGFVADPDRIKKEINELLNQNKKKLEEEKNNKVHNTIDTQEQNTDNINKDVATNHTSIDARNKFQTRKQREKMRQSKKEQQVQNNVKEINATKPTVSNTNNNFRNQSQNKNIFSINSNTAQIASNEEQKQIKEADERDLYLLSNGNYDIRNNVQKTIDTVEGVSGNVIEGVNDFVPAIVDYASAGTELSAKNNIKNGLKFLGYSDKEIEKISTVALENYKKMSPVSLLNSLLNNDSRIQKKNERINKNILKSSSNPFFKKVAEISPSIGSNMVSMGLTAVNPIVGAASFMLSAGGSYLDDAKERGMTDEQAFGYATVMGLLEGR